MDKESYLTREQILFIRPGLDLEILNVFLPADLGIEVTYSIKDPMGLPLDRDGIFTPGPVSASFLVARIPVGATQYESYITRTATSSITGESAIQATSDSCPDLIRRKIHLAVHFQTNKASIVPCL